MPNPPLSHIAQIRKRRKHYITGLTPHRDQISEIIQKTSGTSLIAVGKTPKQIKEERMGEKTAKHKEELQGLIESYRRDQKDHGGEFDGMNCYNTLFVGRLAYEVTERKLLREMEAFGPVKDLRIIQDKTKSDSTEDALGKSRGYAFVEYEHEDDMKRAYRAADGMRLEGREIVVDVERGHTVPSWLPRRLGGGLGGTRIGDVHENCTRPGRFDPSKQPPTNSAPQQPPPPMAGHSSSPHHPHQRPPGDGMVRGGGGGPMIDGGGGGVPPGSGMRMGSGSGHHPRSGPPLLHGGGGGRYGGGSGGGSSSGGPSGRYDDRSRYDDRKRRRSDSPPQGDRRYGGRNRRY